MGLSVGDVRPGKCFTTCDLRPEAPRIAGEVVHQTRGPKIRKRARTGKLELDLEAFLAELAREVGCNYAFETHP